jgi:hypothetical protein
MFDSDKGDKPVLLRCVCVGKGVMLRDFFLHPDDSGFPYLLRIFARCFAIQKVLPSDQKSGGGSKKKFWNGNNGPACTGCIFILFRSLW